MCSSFCFSDSPTSRHALKNKTIFLIGDVIRVPSSDTITPRVTWFDDKGPMTLHAPTLTLRLAVGCANNLWKVTVLAAVATIGLLGGERVRTTSFHHVVKRQVSTPSPTQPQLNGTATGMSSKTVMCIYTCCVCNSFSKIFEILFFNSEDHLNI